VINLVWCPYFLIRE